MVTEISAKTLEQIQHMTVLNLDNRGYKREFTLCRRASSATSPAPL
jgi:hypothetical protein